MSEPRDCEALLVQHLAFIDRMAAKFCRRDGIPDQADDFASWAKERLLENDYARVRKFRGQSSFTTYLTAVLFTLYRDFLVANLGRWRPSAEARRQGPHAVALERLMYRDKYSFTEAVSILQMRGDTERSQREWRAVLQSLPSGNRGRPRDVGEGSLAFLPSAETADRDVVAREESAQRSRIDVELRRAIGRLPPEDAAIVQMRFFQGSSVADIARALRVEQKPLYRRLERALQRLRTELESSGITGKQVVDMLAEIEK